MVMVFKCWMISISGESCISDATGDESDSWRHQLHTVEGKLQIKTRNYPRGEGQRRKFKEGDVIDIHHEVYGQTGLQLRHQVCGAPHGPHYYWQMHGQDGKPGCR